MKRYIFYIDERSKHYILKMIVALLIAVMVCLFYTTIKEIKDKEKKSETKKEEVFVIYRENK